MKKYKRMTTDESIIDLLLENKIKIELTENNPLVIVSARSAIKDLVNLHTSLDRCPNVDRKVKKKFTKAIKSMLQDMVKIEDVLSDTLTGNDGYSITDNVLRSMDKY
jgi:hypothetical protein